MKINFHLNFDGHAEEAFTFYKSVFGGEFSTFKRMKESPKGNMLSKEEQNRIMNIVLTIKGKGVLAGSDILPSMGHVLNSGNQMSCFIHADNRSQINKLFDALSVGGFVENLIKRIII